MARGKHNADKLAAQAIDKAKSTAPEPAREPAQNQVDAGSVSNAEPVARAPARSNGKLGRLASVALIADHLAGGGSVASAFRDNPHLLPSRGKFEEWLARFPNLRAQIEEAQRTRAAHYVDGLAELVEAEPERIATKEGDRIDPGHVAWTKLKVDTHLRIAQALLPERWGEHVVTEHTGHVEHGHTHTVAVLPLDAFAAKLDRVNTKPEPVTIEHKD